MRKIHVSGISTSTIVSSLVRQLCKTARYSRKPCSNHLGKHYSPVLTSSHQWRHQRNTPCSSSGTLGRFCLPQLFVFRFSPSWTPPLHKSSFGQLKSGKEGKKDKEKVTIFHFFGFSISLVICSRSTTCRCVTTGMALYLSNQVE